MAQMTVKTTVKKQWRTVPTVLSKLPAKRQMTMAPQSKATSGVTGVLGSPKLPYPSGGNETEPESVKIPVLSLAGPSGELNLHPHSESRRLKEAVLMEWTSQAPPPLPSAQLRIHSHPDQGRMWRWKHGFSSSHV